MDSIDTKRLNDSNASDRALSGCAVLFLGCSSLEHNFLSLYKDERGKFSVFKVIKLTLSDSVGGLEGYEILKLHDADPYLGVELKFMAMPPCQRFLESYACGSLTQFLSQHASRLLALPDGVEIETQLKAGVHTLDHSLQDIEICLDHIRQSQVCDNIYEWLITPQITDINHILLLLQRGCYSAITDLKVHEDS